MNKNKTEISENTTLQKRLLTWNVDCNRCKENYINSTRCWASVTEDIPIYRCPFNDKIEDKETYGYGVSK